MANVAAEEHSMPFLGNYDVNGNGICGTTDGTIVKRNVAGLPPVGVVTSQLCPNANP
jgi:hypothetical protein